MSLGKLHVPRQRYKAIAIVELILVLRRPALSEGRRMLSDNKCTTPH